MILEQTKLEGCFVLTPRVFEDERGLFLETYNKDVFKKLTGLDINFVQDNQSSSIKGVLRGLHFQERQYAQAKLVRVVKGSALDVCVDLRKNSSTFGEHFSMVLEAKKQQQIFIPRGFAHGFLSLEDDTIFSYKCDNYYNKNSESGILYNDETLGIEWKGVEQNFILSEKDKQLPTFENYFK